MKHRKPLSLLSAALAAHAILLSARPAAAQEAAPAPAAAPKAEMSVVATDKEPLIPGKYQPTWDSLTQREVPDWFRDAKFGIWAHWGPQCQPEHGDWYARNMYEESKGQYKSHLAEYGPDSKTGFKDIIHVWKAQNWNPEELVALYKRAGAKYFFALANHHDNFDLWDSKYQEWNSVAIGPQKNLIAGWAKAARDNGLKFGVSVHAAHAWSWYSVSQGADKTGPLAGVPYDGKLTKADGKGQWWDGLDPQELYEQRHPPTSLAWDWDKGSIPDQKYCEKFYNRTMDLINKYDPDLVYFDDTALPLWPISDAGLKIAANYYNKSAASHDGKVETVIFGKVLTPDQRKSIVWDIERGASNQIEPFPWQTDTCIGGWHYDRSLYDRKKYKSAATVVHMLADIVSKNGNLLLNIPVRGDGTIDDIERGVVTDIGDWMAIHSEAIYATRPFKVFGEGPASDGAPIKAQGFNEGKGKAFTPDDVRYTTKGNALYVISLGVPTKPLNLKTLGKTAGNLDKAIADVTLLGSDEKVAWAQSDDALTLPPPATPASKHTVVYKVTLK
jgi:alpha-L-fucosidase